MKKSISSLTILMRWLCLQVLSACASDSRRRGKRVNCSGGLSTFARSFPATNMFRRTLNCAAFAFAAGMR